MKKGYVYILSSKKNGTFYIGVTSNLVKRAHAHKTEVVEGFTKKYQVHNLVYYEEHQDIREAILREKQLKRWERRWRIKLIESFNPQWKDLFEEIIE